MKSNIAKYIKVKNESNEKILSVFLTAGFPDKSKFTELALDVLNAGADMLEIGFPFSDPIADGPVIQQSSQWALSKEINLETTLHFASGIKNHTDKPIILMGYANPVLSYGVNNFINDCLNSGIDGLIIPDIPVEEYDEFFPPHKKKPDVILLVTPTTPEERIKLIDGKSSGFVYCVSVTGTTGIREKAHPNNTDFIKRTKSLCTNNPVLVGFGISSAQDVHTYKPHCDGVIVGSAVIKSLTNSNGNYDKTLKLVRKLKNALTD